MDIDSEDEDQARLLIDGYLRGQPQLSQESGLLDITKLIHLFFYIPGIVNLDTIFTPAQTPEPMQIDDKNTIIVSNNDPDSDTLKKCKKSVNKLLSSIEPSILLIDGYIRELTDSHNLSTSDLVLDLIQSFYQKMKGTIFVWEITNEKKLLTKILNSNKNTPNNNNKSFDSDVFETITPLTQSKSDLPICANCSKVSNKLSRCTACKQVYYCSRNCQYTHWDKHHANVCVSGHPALLDYNNTNSIFDHDVSAADSENKMDDLSLKWYIKLYPNGSDFDSLGQIELELILVSLPSIFSCVSFIYQIYCHELNLYWCEQIEFSNDQTRHFLSESVNGEASVKLLNDLQILFEMNKLQKLRFFCTFNIIRCGMKRTNINSKYKYKYNPLYFFDETQYLKTVDIDSIGDFLMRNNEFKFKWTVNEDILGALCSGINMDHPRCVISDLYFNQWALSLHHHKMKVRKQSIDEQESKNDGLVAAMDDLVAKVDNEVSGQDVITIGLELCSLPSNISSFVAQIKLFCLQFSCQWSIVKKFSYSNRYYSDLCVNNIFDYENLKHLSIFADIKIIEVFDEYGEEQQLKIKQHKQKHRQEVIKKYNKVIDTYNIRFKAVICGDLNMRYHYQNIGLMNDELDQVSVEELRCQDERNTNFALYRTNAVPMIIASNMLKKKKQLSFNRTGTYGYHFQPFQQKSSSTSKRYKIFNYYYQHICVGTDDSPFKQKSCEELQFEDRFPLQNKMSFDKRWSWKSIHDTIVGSEVESVLENGLLVEVNGLRGSLSKFNGKKGKIISFDESNKKYKIKLNDKKRGLLNVKKHNVFVEQEENKLEKKTDCNWKFEYNDNKWSWNNNGGNSDNFKKEDDKKELEEVIKFNGDKVEFKEMENKIELITDKLEKMRNLMYKIYDSALLNENDENKNEIKRMFNDFDGKEFNDLDEKKTNEKTKEMQLKDWLQNVLGLSEYYELFIDEGIDDLQTLKLVNYQQLKEIGVKKLGHRIKILHKLKDL